MVNLWLRHSAGRILGRFLLDWDVAIGAAARRLPCATAGLKDGRNLPASSIVDVQMHHRLLHTTTECLARKRELPFPKWERPDKKTFLLRNRQLESAFEPVDLSKPMLRFRQSKELAEADEAVQKVFSAGFAHKRHIADDILHDYVEKFRKYPGDETSLQVRIAALTAQIRNLHMHAKEHRKEMNGCVALKEKIDKRSKLFRQLRKIDHERFDWLLKELKITYQPPPRYHYRIERKKSMREITANYCEAIRVARLREHRDALRKMQEEFLKEKEETLKFIADEEKALGLVVEAEGVCGGTIEPGVTIPPVPVSSTLEIQARTAEAQHLKPDQYPGPTDVFPSRKSFQDEEPKQG